MKRYVGRKNSSELPSVIWNMVCFQSPFCVWKDYSLFYSSLFTKPPETPINTGLPSGEEWLGTLHHSSPLFTTLHRINAEPLTYAREYCWAATYHEAWSSLMTSAGLQWWLKQGVGNNLGASKNTGWREVKSGEECIATLHPYKPLIYSWLYCICEEWRVFLKVALYSSNAAKLLRKMWEIAAKLLRKMWEIGQKVLRKMWEIAAKLLRKMWFFIRNPLIMSLFCKRD